MILALDLGSTSFKAGVFDERLRQVTHGQARLRHRFGAHGQAELEVAGVHSALRTALESARVREYDVRVVSVTSQAQTFTLVDPRGRPQMPFVSWQDTRATAACEELKRELPTFGEQGSFAELIPGLQVCQLRRLRPEGSVAPLLLPSYVVRLWTGESVTDNNLAAMSGLYSLPLGAWWPEAVQACGLRTSALPRVVAVGAVAAETTAAARRFGLPVGIPVVLAGNDQTAGGFAAGLEQRPALLVTLGTAQVAYVCRTALPRPRSGTIRGPYPGGRHYRMAADGNGGNVVNWAQTVIADCGDDVTFFREAARAPRGCRGLTFEAALDTEAGAWRGLGRHHTSADLARSVLECLAQRLAGMVRRLGVQVEGRQVLVAGGGGAQPLWRRIVAEALAARLTPTEANPLAGAARMGAT